MAEASIVPNVTDNYMCALSVGPKVLLFRVDNEGVAADVPNLLSWEELGKVDGHSVELVVVQDFAKKYFTATLLDDSVILLGGQSRLVFHGDEDERYEFCRRAFKIDLALKEVSGFQGPPIREHTAVASTTRESELLVFGGMIWASSEHKSFDMVNDIFYCEVGAAELSQPLRKYGKPPVERVNHGCYVSNIENERNKELLFVYGGFDLDIRPLFDLNIARIELLNGKRSATWSTVKHNVVFLKPVMKFLTTGELAVLCSKYVFTCKPEEGIKSYMLIGASQPDTPLVLLNTKKVITIDARGKVRVRTW